jgi:hypothetical protein
MATFQFFKETLLKTDGSNLDGSYLGLSISSVSGILGLFAAAIAAVLTQPADVIKTRLMTKIENDVTNFQISQDEHQVNPNPISNPQDEYLVKIQNIGIIKTTQQIIEEQGWEGLFVGLVPRLILVSLGGMVYFWAAEVATEMFEVSLSK